MPTLARGLLGVALLAITVISARADQSADVEAIRKRLHEWRTAFNEQNAIGACDLFAPDLAYSVPGIPHGDYETMCDNFKRLFTTNQLKLAYSEPDIREIFVSGDIGVVRLTWKLTTEADGTQESTTEEGMDIFVRQQDGRWSIKRFIAF